ncbi:MAG: nitrate ABC transporter substrate-binding protein, partial [Betaproteobacteria bacterium]
EQVKQQQTGVYHLPAAEMLGYCQKRDDSKSLHKVGAGIGDILVHRGQIKATPRIEDTFDPRFVEALAKAP